MESPTTTSLHDVWGMSDDDVYAVGDEGTIIHYDGASWSIMPSCVTESLHGVGGNASDNVIIVGGSGTVLHLR